MFFTYPYMNFNFSLSGYPLTFLTMLAVSLTVNTLTATLKRQERIRMEAETERMRANLLRAISHDLRTPFTAISGSAITLLENDNLPDWQKKKLLGSINDDAGMAYPHGGKFFRNAHRPGIGANPKKQDEVAEEVIFSAISKFKAHFPGAVFRIGDVFTLIQQWCHEPSENSSPMDPVNGLACAAGERRGVHRAG